MQAKSKLWLVNNKNIINIVRFTLLSLVLLIITWIVDIRYPWLKIGVPEIFLLSAEVSNTFLSNLSGVFLTVTTFTFTTILTVVTTYASSFTPRAVQKFINKPNVLSLFGIFVGGFFYTVMSLFLLQNIALDQQVLSGTIGILYAITSMIYFILFVQRVLRDIKGSNLISDIYDEASILIAEEASERKASERWSQERIREKFSIYSEVSGYLYSIDHQRILQLLGDIPSELVIIKKIGEYIPKGVYLANLHVLDEYQMDDEKKVLFGQIADCFIMNSAKNESQDYHHEIMNLQEIACRAIGPGVNDPYTGANCIRAMSLLLGKLFSTKNKFIVEASNDTAKVIYESYSVQEELYLAFSEILHFGKNDPAVAYALLDGLYTIYMAADRSAYKEIEKFFQEFYKICEEAQSTEIDKAQLRKIKRNFLSQDEKNYNKEVLREENILVEE